MTTNMFSRQISLLGKDNQKLIETAKIGIVGLGGLGSAVAHLLVRMGIKHFVLVDDDIIADHNLSRQHLYTNEDIGFFKVEAAKRHLENINPNIKVELKKIRVKEVSDLDYLKDSTLIIDGLDNHDTRRLLDNFCKKNNISWIHGSGIQEKGVVFFFNKDIKYDDIYSPNAPDTHCNLLGVLATTTTMVATIQSQLVINFIIKRPIENKLININMNNLSFESYKKNNLIN